MLQGNLRLSGKICMGLHCAAPCRICPVERLARAGASPTRSGPEGSSRNESRLGRCPASHPFPQASELRKRPCLAGAGSIFGARGARTKASGAGKPVPCVLRKSPYGPEYLNEIIMVRVEGLEPPCLAAPEPKSGASANFATPASSEADREARANRAVLAKPFRAREGESTAPDRGTRQEAARAGRRRSGRGRSGGRRRHEGRPPWRRRPGTGSPVPAARR